MENIVSTNSDKDVTWVELGCSVVGHQTNYKRICHFMDGIQPGHILFGCPLGQSHRWYCGSAAARHPIAIKIDTKSRVIIAGYSIPNGLPCDVLHGKPGLEQ
jgi:hypothetical protein